MGSPVLFNADAKFTTVDLDQRLVSDKLNSFPVQELREYHYAMFTLTSQCKCFVTKQV
jgi:hypothetical protein